MKNCLAKINADRVQFHGTPPPQASHTQATDQEKAADHPIN
jgi:hypothetical protein